MDIYLREELSKTLIVNGVSSYGAAYRGESAAIDLYYAGGEPLYVAPAHEKNVLVPTGLHINLPSDWVGLIRGRGSITKTPLIVRAGVIDPGYTGQIFVATMNTSSESYIIEPRSKLPFQMVVVPFRNDFNIVTKSIFEMGITEAKRGTGKIGSSD